MLVPFVGEVFFRIHWVSDPPSAVLRLDKTPHVSSDVIKGVECVRLICIGQCCQRGDNDRNRLVIWIADVTNIAMALEKLNRTAKWSSHSPNRNACDINVECFGGEAALFGKDRG